MHFKLRRFCLCSWQDNAMADLDFYLYSSAKCVLFKARTIEWNVHVECICLLKKIRLTTNFGSSMSANFSSIRKIENFQTKFRLLIGILLLILLILEVGCASLASKGLLPEIAKRHPPDVHLGAELILFEEPPILSISLIDMDGVAHVFLVDEERRLNHIEILRDKIITREILGVIEKKKAKTLDAVEHPRGKLRVLSGDKQYFRNTPNAEWHEIKGNRCAQFLPVGDDLFCAFIIKGEEVEAPERTDVTLGIFQILPIVYWSHKYASKLVLAQESQDGWIIRVVIDPDTLFDANQDFVLEKDNQGNLHFLYFTSKGGGLFLIYSIEVMGEAWTEGALRYAEVTFDQLLAQTTDTHNQTSNQISAPLQWLPAKGVTLANIPCIRGNLKLRPLNRYFSVNKLTGNVNGLVSLINATLIDGNRQLDLGQNDCLKVEVSIHDGLWSSHCDIVTTTDLPISNYIWFHIQNPLIKIDSKGNKHVLLKSLELGFFKSLYKMHYLVKDNVNWSAPLFLGTCDISSLSSSDSSLAIDNSGAVFASWVNKEDKFVGRWIRPRNEKHQ